MKTRGAIIKAVGQDWEVVDLELGEPNDTEVLIEVHASGLCHSDAHLTDGDLQVELPFVGGHEGAGIVRKVGAGVTRVKVGDHVCTSFIPGCGTCKYCARGQSYVCQNGYLMEKGISMDGTPRFFLDGEPLGAILRVPRGDDIRSNIHVGGSVVPTELTARELAMVAAIGPKLREDGLYFVGLDVIGERLTEVNVTSPTGIQELGRFTGTTPSDKVIAWVEKKRGEAKA